MTRNASPLAPALALFVLSIVSGCAGLEIDGDVAQAEISHVLGPSSALDTGVEPTQARVYEDGLYYPFKVVVRRHQGQTVRIAAWTNDNRFLGEKSVVPPYESTEWKRLSLFMPYSGIHLGSESIDGNVYVLEPGDSRKYLATVGMGVTSIARQRFIWSFREFWEDATLRTGDKGIRLGVDLHRFGFTDTTHRVVLAVRDEKRNEFPSSLGGPIRIDSTRLTAPADSSQLTWNLQLDLPYDELKQFGEGRAITVTPAVRMNDGTLYMGNVHVEFLVGGSPEKMAGKIREEIERVDRRIRTLQKEFETLQGR